MKINTTDIPKRLYTLKEAARYLGRPVWGVRELIWSGELPVIRRTPRGKQFLDIRDLERFVDQSKSFEMQLPQGPGEGGAS